MKGDSEFHGGIQRTALHLARWYGVEADELRPFAKVADLFLPHFTREAACPIERMLVALGRLYSALQLAKRLDEGSELPSDLADADGLIDLIALDIQAARTGLPTQVLVVWARYLSLPREVKDSLEALGAATGR